MPRRAPKLPWGTTTPSRANLPHRPRQNPLQPLREPEMHHLAKLAVQKMLIKEPLVRKTGAANVRVRARIAHFQLQPPHLLQTLQK